MMSATEGDSAAVEDARLQSSPQAVPQTAPQEPTRSNAALHNLVNGQPQQGNSREVTKTCDTWINSEQNASVDSDVPIHDQIKQDILGFIENEIKKSDTKPSFVFYSHDPSAPEDRLTVKNSLSRPSSGHREKRSPSQRKKRKHLSKRDRDHSEFDVPGSSLNALEKVDDYLREYNKEEVVTLSGDLEIEPNDVVNNNGNATEAKYKQRKTRRKTRDERQDKSNEVSPRVHAPTKAKHVPKPARPTNLSSIFDQLDNSNYQDLYIDNPFSSPSPVASPSDARSVFGSRPDRVYLQNSTDGSFRAVSRTTLTEPQRQGEQKYLSFVDLTPLDIALAVQRAWRGIAPACHGMLGGLSLMHLFLICCTDGMDAAHLSFHAVVTMPYVAAYYLLCVLCLLSVLDRLDVTSVDPGRGLQPYFQPLVLVILYSACLLVCTAARRHDQSMTLQYPNTDNFTAFNVTHTPTIPTFYSTWTHLSIWRAVLSLLGLAYLMITSPPDLVYANLTKLLQFKQTLQSIG